MARYLDPVPGEEEHNQLSKPIVAGFDIENYIRVAFPISVWEDTMLCCPGLDTDSRSGALSHGCVQCRASK